MSPRPERDDFANTLRSLAGKPLLGKIWVFEYALPDLGLYVRARK